MKNELQMKAQKWSTEKQAGYMLMGTDDLDSQVSITLLNQVLGYEQNAYVTRNGVYSIDTAQRKHIGVDLACGHNRMTYDNHLTMINNNSHVNPNSMNANALYKITNDSYKYKCAFSTALQIYSLFDIPLPKTDEGKMFLLSIDSSHLGHYNNYSDFKQIHTDWLERLGLTELLEVLNKYSKEQISAMRINRNSEKLTFKDGILTYDEAYKAHAEQLLGYELYLPKGEFTQVATFEQNYQNIHRLKTDITRDSNVFSFALTKKNEVSFSRIKALHTN